jgi:hypothetical protein
VAASAGTSAAVAPSNSRQKMPVAPVDLMDTASDHDDVVEYDSGDDEDETEAPMSDDEDEVAAPASGASRPIVRADKNSNKTTPSKKISVFELQMEGVANNDAANVGKVNPSTKLKPSQAPEGYANESSLHREYDINELAEAPRPSRSAVDPTSRPKTMRGNSFDASDQVFDNDERRTGDKKPTPVERHLLDKQEKPASSEFTKPVEHADEAARPSYAVRPDGVRGKSNLDVNAIAKVQQSGQGQVESEARTYDSTARSSAPFVSAAAVSKDVPTLPSKKISVFEMQMEGIASNDNEKIDKVNPSAKIKPPQAPEGYVDESSLHRPYDIDALQEAPRPAKSSLDPTSRPKTMRGNSFGASDFAFDQEAVRRSGEKKPKPVDLHLQEKQLEDVETPEYSKPIVHADETARPEYAVRPGVVRGKSGIEDDMLQSSTDAPRGGKKKTDMEGVTMDGGRRRPPSHTYSNEALPHVTRDTGFGVTLRGSKKGEKLLAGQEIAHSIGGIKLVDDETN